MATMAAASPSSSPSVVVRGEGGEVLTNTASAPKTRPLANGTVANPPMLGCQLWNLRWRPHHGETNVGGGCGRVASQTLHRVSERPTLGRARGGCDSPFIDGDALLEASSAAEAAPSPPPSRSASLPALSLGSSPRRSPRSRPGGVIFFLDLRHFAARSLPARPCPRTRDNRLGVVQLHDLHHRDGTKSLPGILRGHFTAMHLTRARTSSR